MVGVWDRGTMKGMGWWPRATCATLAATPRCVGSGAGLSLGVGPGLKPIDSPLYILHCQPFCSAFVSCLIIITPPLACVLF